MTKIHQRLLQTIQNYNDLKAKIKEPPKIDGFILKCNWWSGTKCRYQLIDTPFNIKCFKISGQGKEKIPSIREFLIRVRQNKLVFTSKLFVKPQFKQFIYKTTKKKVHF